MNTVTRAFWNVVYDIGEALARAGHSPAPVRLRSDAAGLDLDKVLGQLRSGTTDADTATAEALSEWTLRTCLPTWLRAAGQRRLARRMATADDPRPLLAAAHDKLRLRLNARGWDRVNHCGVVERQTLTFCAQVTQILNADGGRYPWATTAEQVITWSGALVDPRKPGIDANHLRVTLTNLLTEHNQS